ncbi:hypothetical protein HDU83_009702, partial [Entophlyctis luteolus]
PTTPLTSVTPASRDPAVSDVTVPASIASVDAADTTASSTPIVAGPSSGNFYMKRELEDWLNPVSFESDMASYASQYVEGTRYWALDAIGKQFAGDANVVWLNGAVVLASHSWHIWLPLLRHPASLFCLPFSASTTMRKKTMQNRLFAGLSMIWPVRHHLLDEKKNNAKQIVCRLVYDLACVSPLAFSKLRWLMQQDKDYCTRNPTALSILDKPIVAFSTLFLELLPLLGASSDQGTATRYLIVIDAVDECGTQGDPTRNGLLSLLASLNTGSSNAAAKLPPFVKILTTGRPEADIWRVMESLRTDSLEPTAEANIRDIEL